MDKSKLGNVLSSFMAAKSESEEIRSNLRAVKGDNFADAVDAVVYAGLTIIAFVSASKGISKEQFEKLTDVMTSLAANTISALMNAYKYDLKTQKEIEDWAERILEVYKKNAPSNN